MDNNHDHFHDDIRLPDARFLWLTVFNSGITIAELIGGVLSGSLSLLSDAVHNMSDAVAIVISYIAWKQSYVRLPGAQSGPVGVTIAALAGSISLIP